MCNNIIKCNSVEERDPDISGRVIVTYNDGEEEVSIEECWRSIPIGMEIYPEQLGFGEIHENVISGEELPRTYQTEHLFENEKQNKISRLKSIQPQKEIHYFIVIEHNDWNHDDDQWIGIYDDLSKLEMAYDRTCESLIEEISNTQSLSDDRSVQIYRFDEDNLFVKINALELFHK